MKIFNYLKAKQGEPICTREGKDAKIIYHERDSPHFPLVVIIENKEVTFYNYEGKWYTDKDSDRDLFMK